MGNKWAIRCTPHYFAGDIWGRDREYLVRGFSMHSDESTIVLGSEEDATTLCKILSYWRGGLRQLDHNQYDPPEYCAQPYHGSCPAIDLPAAARALGYGYSDDGDWLTDDQLRQKIKRMSE